MTNHPMLTQLNSFVAFHRILLSSFQLFVAVLGVLGSVQDKADPPLNTLVFQGYLQLVFFVPLASSQTWRLIINYESLADSLGLFPN